MSDKMSDQIVKLPDGFYTVKNHTPPDMSLSALERAISHLLAPISIEKNTPVSE